MNEQFQENPSLTPPNEPAESELDAGASASLAGPSAVSGSADRDSPQIANLNLGPHDQGNRSGTDEDSVSSGMPRDFRTAVTHGREVCDAYVHDNPWNSVVLAVAVGLVVGLLLTRSPPRFGGLV